MKKLFVSLFCSLLLLGGTFSVAEAMTAQDPNSTGVDYSALYSQLQALQQQIYGWQWRNNVNTGGGVGSSVGTGSSGGAGTSPNYWVPLSVVPTDNSAQATVADENGTIALITPDGNTLKPGDSLNIRWRTSGFTSGIKTLGIYKINTLIQTISRNIPETANSYSWTIPSDFATGDYRVALKDNVTGVTSAFNDGMFTVDTTVVSPPSMPEQPTGKSLSLISPDGNSYKVGSGATVYVKWTSSGLNGDVTLSVYKGTSLIQKISGDIPVTQKTYSWTLPNNLAVGDYRVVIKNNTTGINSVGDEGIFTVISESTDVTPKITVLSPKGGEKYKIGGTVTIKWSAKNLPSLAKDTVSVALGRFENGNLVENMGVWPSDGSGYGEKNTGSKSWTIPANLKPGLYKIRINPACPGGSFVVTNDAPCMQLGESANTFEIMANLYTGTPVKLTYPNGKEKLEIGKVYTIRWTARSFKTMADVQLGIIDTRYSSEGGDRSERAIANTKNTGSYKWTVPANIGTLDFSDTSDPVYRIKLYVGNQEVNDFDQSDNTFSIIDARAKNVKVSLSASTPKSRNVKLGEQNAEFLKFDVKNNGKEDIVITGVKLNGAFSSDDLQNIYVYNDSVLVGSGMVPSNINGLQLSINSPVTIDSGISKTLTVKADLGMNTGGIKQETNIGVEKINIRIGDKTFEIPVTNVQGKKMTIVSEGIVSSVTPGAPTGVSATATGQTTASLSWTRNAPFTDSWWEVSGVGNVGGAGVTSGNISGLACGTQYLFNLRSAVTSNGRTYYSSYAQSNYITTDPCSLSALGTPTGLTATVSGKNVVLSWSAVSGATAYNIYRALPTISRTSAQYLDWANGVATYTDASICSGKTGQITYMYYIDAYAGTSASGATQRSARSQGVNATINCGTGSLSAPTNLTVSGTSQTQINLSWDAVQGATSYNVYRRFVTGNYVRVTHSVSGTNYSDKSLSCSAPLTLDTFYEYYVVAVNATGISGESNHVHGNTQNCSSSTSLSAPAGLTGTAVSPTSVKLTWSAVTGADGYNIYRDGNLVARERGQAFHYDEGLSVSTSYVYKVEAYKYDSNWNILASNNFSDSITVKTAAVSPTTRVISPNGGETYKIGDTVSIKWMVTGMGNSNSVAVSVYKYRSDNNYYGIRPDFGVTWYNDYTSSGTLDTGSYNWTVPTTLALGQYVVFVAGSTAISDTSDGPFTIVSKNVSATLLDTIQVQLDELRQTLLNLR